MPQIEPASSSGHRARLRQRFLADSTALSDAELVELVLTYVIPRQDVAPQAQALLARFPEGYRHLAYLQSKIGYPIKLNLPGLDGPDLDAAADGIVASAFGFQGQKCSACSRAVVVKPAYREVLDRVLERAKSVASKRLSVLEKKIHKLAGQPFNVASPTSGAVTVHGWRTCAPSSRARARRRASKSARAT